MSTINNLEKALTLGVLGGKIKVNRSTICDDRSIAIALRLYAS